MDRSKTLVTIFGLGGLAGALGLAVAPDTFAHGGSHPTPWPSPEPGPSPSPGPSPGPSPSPSPSPSGTPGRTSSGGGTSPSGPGTTGGAASGPTGPTKPKGPTRPTGELRWEEWWRFNQWVYTRVGRKGTQVTAGEGSAAAENPVLSFFRKCLSDSYFDVRSAACMGLGKAGDAAAAAAVMPLVDDANETVQESALLCLGMIRATSVVPDLLKVVENKNKYKTRLRATAVLSLGFIGDKQVVPKLVEILERGGDREVTAAAIVALGFLRDEAALEPLYKIISAVGGVEDETVTLRAYCVTALGKVGIPQFNVKGKTQTVSDLVRTLLKTDREKEVRQSAVLALGALGDEKWLGDVKWAIENDKDAMVRNFAMVVAARLAKSEASKGIVRRDLEKQLTGKDHTGRGFAALALGLLADSEGARALRVAFDTETDPSNKSAAAIGLGLLRDSESATKLVSAIQLTRDNTLRGYCCVALGMMRGTEAIPELRRVLLEERAPELRAAAAVALANAGDRQALESLKKLLEDNNAYIKMSTIMAMGYFRDDAVVPDLRKAYEKESNGEVKAILLVALGYIVDRSDIPILKSVATDFNYLLHYPSIDTVIRLH
ncbi:MAG: HEAT repeat domain-containing protein [Planctomycetales bacterium]|nr:HEAT repeat domain-containing protein [Planctomycetales bacterium]